MKILIVEDAIGMATCAKMILDSRKHEVDISLTPTEAKKAVAENHYDAIFMDYGLPEMNGLELTTFLRSTGYAGLVIGLTANAETFTIQQMKDAGLNACLEKPLSIEKLKLLELDPSTTDFETTFD